MTLKPGIKNFRGLFQRELIGLITIYIILVYFAGVEEWKTFLPFMIIGFFIIEWLPALYFSWSYYKVNKGHQFILDDGSLEVVTDGKRKRYKKEEMNQIVIYMSGNNPRFNVAFLSMEFFHYAKIVMKNGEQVVITSICAEQVDAILEEYMEGVPIEYNWGFPNIGRLNPKKTE